MRYTKKQRKRVSEDAKGKTIKSMDWEPVGQCWVITFTDESELFVRLMVELV